MSLLTSDDVRKALFTQTQFRRGYDVLEVDSLLGDVAYTIDQLNDESRHLTAQLRQRDDDVEDLALELLSMRTGVEELKMEVERMRDKITDLEWENDSFSNANQELSDQVKELGEELGTRQEWY